MGKVHYGDCRTNKGIQEKVNSQCLIIRWGYKGVKYSVVPSILNKKGGSNLWLKMELIVKTLLLEL